MTRENPVVKIPDDHTSQKRRNYPMALPRSSWKITQQPIVNLKLTSRGFLVLDLFSKIFTENIAPLMLLQGRVHQWQGTQHRGANQLRIVGTMSLKHVGQRVCNNTVNPARVYNFKFKRGQAQNPSAQTTHVFHPF
jgi:hypothetical protein